MLSLHYNNIKPGKAINFDEKYRAVQNIVDICIQKIKPIRKFFKKFKEWTCNSVPVFMNINTCYEPSKAHNTDYVAAKKEV